MANEIDYISLQKLLQNPYQNYMDYTQMPAYSHNLQYSFNPSFTGYNTNFLGQETYQNLSQLNNDNVNISATDNIRSQTTKAKTSNAGKWAIGTTLVLTTGTLYGLYKHGGIKAKNIDEAWKSVKEGWKKIWEKEKPTTSTTDKAFSILPEDFDITKTTREDLIKIYRDSYNKIRKSEKFIEREISESESKKYFENLSKITSDIKIDDFFEDWVYRYPSHFKDEIHKFTVTPKSRISMNTNMSPDLLDVLDRYISKGEVIVDGIVKKTVTPPNAYYKSSSYKEHLIKRSDPITMYFRDELTPEQLNDVAMITKPFKCTKEISSDVVFLKGQKLDATWLSSAKEYSPDVTYKLFLKAKELDPTLADFLGFEITKSVRAGKGPHTYSFKKTDGTLFETSGNQYRLSETQNYILESLIEDYKKILHK